MSLDNKLHNYYAYEELMFSELELYISDLKEKNTTLLNNITFFDTAGLKEFNLFKKYVRMCGDLQTEIQSYLISLEPLYDELKPTVEIKCARLSDNESIARPTCEFMGNVIKKVRVINKETERISTVLSLMEAYNEN